MAQLTALPLRRVLRNMFGNDLVFACVKWYEGGEGETEATKD